MITNIRKTLPGDLNYLLDIDLKGFEDNLTLDDWRERLEADEFGILVGTVQTTPVGLIMWQENIIVRLAVKPAYRLRGIGTKLLEAVENTLIHRNSGLVAIHIPESLCCPGRPIDTSAWLCKRGFRAESILRGQAVFCGTPEDLIVFTKMLSETITHG